MPYLTHYWLALIRLQCNGGGGWGYCYVCCQHNRVLQPPVHLPVDGAQRRVLHSAPEAVHMLRGVSVSYVVSASVRVAHARSGPTGLRHPR